MRGAELKRQVKEERGLIEDGDMHHTVKSGGLGDPWPPQGQGGRRMVLKGVSFSTKHRGSLNPRKGGGKVQKDTRVSKGAKDLSNTDDEKERSGQRGDAVHSASSRRGKRQGPDGGSRAGS